MCRGLDLEALPLSGGGKVSVSACQAASKDLEFYSLR